MHDNGSIVDGKRPPCILDNSHTLYHDCNRHTFCKSKATAEKISPILDIRIRAIYTNDAWCRSLKLNTSVNRKSSTAEALSRKILSQFVSKGRRL